MSDTEIPSYPIVTVDLRADGSAHLNVAGRHLDYPAAPLSETRAAVTNYAVELAITMGRAIRMTTSGPDRKYTLAVHPDGRVTDLAPVDARQRRRRAIALEHTAPQATASTPNRPAAALSPAVKPATTADVPDQPAAASSPVLRFSTGETVSVQRSVLVGRHPHVHPDAGLDDLAVLHDPGRTVSKTHFRARWEQHSLWITDLGSGNGTRVQHATAALVELIPGEPHQVNHGDVVHIGEQSFTVQFETSHTPGGTGR